MKAEVLLNNLASPERAKPEAVRGFIAPQFSPPQRNARRVLFCLGKRMSPGAVDRNQIPIHLRDEGRDCEINNHCEVGIEMTPRPSESKKAVPAACAADPMLQVDGSTVEETHSGLTR
jgi:hypothetical protein